MKRSPEPIQVRIREENWKLDCMRASHEDHGNYNPYQDRHLAYFLNRRQKQLGSQKQLPSGQMHYEYLKVAESARLPRLPAIQPAESTIMRIYTKRGKQSRSQSNSRYTSQKALDAGEFRAFLQQMRAQVT